MVQHFTTYPQTLTGAWTEGLEQHPDTLPEKRRLSHLALAATFRTGHETRAERWISLLLGYGGYGVLTATLLMLRLSVIWMEASMGMRVGNRLRELSGDLDRADKSSQLTVPRA